MHASLQNYYETNFALIHHHKWQIEHIENLLPWEKEIYMNLLVQFLQEEDKNRRDQQAKSGG
jgi:hypothetical protein|tara:strand:- start:50 stop:235 length:186 start_codon:yes stop_codon:yes gene_type:complete